MPDRQREELAAAVAARRELGDDYDQAMVESFLDRVDAGIDRRIDERIAQTRTSGALPAAERQPELAGDRQFWLGIISICAGIPLGGIGANAGMGGLLTTWLGIVGVNVAYALGQRRRRG